MATKTDDLGRFRLHLPEGHFLLRVLHERFQHSRVVNVPLPSPLILNEGELAEIRVDVKDSNGVPAKDFPVILRGELEGLSPDQERHDCCSRERVHFQESYNQRFAS